MSRILILEPFYTNFHIDLARSMSNDIYSFVFNVGNIIYLKGSKQHFVHKQILKAQYTSLDISLAYKTKNLYTESLRKISKIEPSESAFQYMAKYIAYLRIFIIDEKIDLLLMHNDLRWQHALAIEVCKELEVRYLVTERGLFRPDTTTVETIGVNAYSSIPQYADFYRSAKWDSKTIKSYQPTFIINTIVNMNFLLFVLVNKLGRLFRVNCPLVNKRYRLRNYCSLIFKFRSRFHQINSNALSNKYIFVPLQVNTDTQILVHSQYTNMQQFITQIETTFYALNSNYHLVFKVHPMESSSVYTFNKRSIVTNIDTKKLIDDSEFVITINSTVGFEAIQSYKKVIVLGDAFYKINGIAICSSIESFRNELLNCLNKLSVIDHDLIDKFINYLRYEYQINGSLFNYDAETFSAIKSRLDKRVSL